MRKMILSILVTAVTICSQTYAVSEITLDHVDGQSSPGELPAGIPLTFQFRLTNSTGEAIHGLTHGFQVYSPDGATWQPITWDTAALDWSAMLDGDFLFFPQSVTGSDADTIGFLGFRMLSPGIPDSFSDIVWTISTSIDQSQTGKTLCVDSSFFAAGGFWLWATATGTVVPKWDGPHCFNIVSGCVCGDVNLSGGFNVADLTYIVDYMFHGGPPLECCGH